MFQKRPLFGAVSVLGKRLLTIWTHHGEHAEAPANTRPKKKAHFQGLC
jgi:hypothetical protein